MTGRIGLLVPATNTTCEVDLWRATPPEVTVHSHRLPLTDWSGDQQSMARMNTEVEGAAVQVAAADVDVIAYGCTSGSFVAGASHDGAIAGTIAAAADVPVVVASPATVQALRAVGARRIAVATPYPAWIADHLASYYSTQGFDVVHLERDEAAAASGARGINEQAPERIEDAARRALRPGVDALFLSCTAWRAFELVEHLEADLDLPVVTSNHAITWACLHALSVPVPAAGFGALGQVAPGDR